MQRHFNIAGPCDPDRHYMLPAAERLPRVPHLVSRGAYFVVHAPRQTGKTTTLRAIAQSLAAGGKYAAVCFSCEAGQPFESDVGAAERAVLEDLRLSAQIDLPEILQPPTWPDAPDGSQVRAGLQAWAMACPRPLVLIFDEIDALTGPALSSVLRQLRAGFHRRPTAAPWSVVLCGLRDVRDDKLASGGRPPQSTSSSPFNIKGATLRLDDFGHDEITCLLSQHTDATGQPFGPDAADLLTTLTQGQPWLINALANEIIDEMGITGPIDASHVEVASQRLICARVTHLDQLADKLRQRRVRQLVEPMIAGSFDLPLAHPDDLQYVRDLGLLAQSDPAAPANPIYREIMIRELSEPASNVIVLDPARPFVGTDGRLDLATILTEFAGFWTQNGDVVGRNMPYHEVAAQLVLMAYLQRVINGGGYVDREYGIGRGRIDLLIRWLPPQSAHPTHCDVVRNTALGDHRHEIDNRVDASVWVRSARGPGTGAKFGPNLTRVAAATCCTVLRPVHIGLGPALLGPRGDSLPWQSVHRSFKPTHSTSGSR